jgi:hypothetical protein
VGDVQGPEKVTILACKQCMQEWWIDISLYSFVPSSE